MRLALKRHPDSLSAASTRIEVEFERPHNDRLVLSYNVSGPIGDIRMPPVAIAARGEELWRHTCFEAFVAAGSQGCYYEFNFSPSTRWAAYRFDGYRRGMVDAEIAAPDIDVHAAADHYTLRARLDLDRLVRLPAGGSWRLGLSALIEDLGGRISYWALAHPAGKPDFHHADGFVHEISPRGGA